VVRGKSSLQSRMVKPHSMKKKLIEIPTELFDKIVRLASEKDRSVNKEINHLLKSAVGKK
jgi:hypothetical protein